MCIIPAAGTKFSNLVLHVPVDLRCHIGILILDLPMMQQVPVLESSHNHSTF
eukprot:SAG31_NODE_17573_length_666_cov_0.885362_1_plen_52_part_00